MNRGFSLIEIVISIGIFAVVMTVALGALLSINLANKRAQSVRIVLDNVNFALENMARELRLGKNYHCGADVAFDRSISFSPADCSSSEGIAFLSPATNPGQFIQTQYRLGPIAGTQCLTQSLCISQDDTTFYPLTSPPEITIEKLNFVVTGSGRDSLQPQVIINLAGVGRGYDSDNAKFDFKIQTTVTQRTVDQQER